MEHNAGGRLGPGDTARKYIARHIIPGYSEVAIDQFQLFNVDSSLFTPAHWILLAQRIESLYEIYDGFIIIHGTDTLAYSAAALSFMLEGLDKPVVCTGSQLPVFEKRSDAFSNLNASIEVVLHGGIHEVAVVFNNNVYRGNRIKKRDVWDFHAFYSPNYGLLLRLGIDLEKHESLYLPESPGNFHVDTRLCPDIMHIPFYPGIDFSFYNPALSEGRVRGVVIEAYGSGNIPSNNPGLDELFLHASRETIPVVICSQSPKGGVNLELYEAAEKASFYGLISAGDMTRETTLVKLMIALGRFTDSAHIKSFMAADIAGEKS